MNPRWLTFILSFVIAMGVGTAGSGASAERYYAHQVVEDRYGVIAPWYEGQNGQCDLRVRIAVETLKRYPWAYGEQAVTPAPHFVFNGRWRIDDQGGITIPGIDLETATRRELPRDDWTNGDLGPRANRIIFAMMEYYRYSGDPAALSFIKLTADYIVGYCQTPSDHPWPNVLVSCPTKGKMYSECDPHGFIQLDHVAATGLALIKAYKIVGEERWLEAAKHWADLFAMHCNSAPDVAPWPRYANPQDVRWGMEPDGNVMTGGVAWVLAFLDELIDMGYTGKDDSAVKARDAGRRYLRGELLPKWYEDPTWGYNYWDWKSPTSNHNVVYWTCRYLMDNQDYFPNWKNDVRNIMTIMLNRASTNPTGKGGVHSGAWAHPESTGCCDDANGYGPQRTAGLFLQYAGLTGSEWAREIGRRMAILSSYDILENGVVIDSMFTGKPRVAGGWFKIAVPNPILFFLRNMSFLPIELGANRENHIMSSSSVVRSVTYGKGNVAYTTFDASQPCMDVLRLAFDPETVQADGGPLKRVSALDSNGYQVQPLSSGDFLVTVRHDGARNVSVRGDDPQQEVDDDELQYDGEWRVSRNAKDLGGAVRVASQEGAALSYTFAGNQVRVVGRADRKGGRADVYLDGERQLAGIDFWCPSPRNRQVLYHKNGLKPGKHTIKVVAAGEGNPLCQGTNIYIDGIQFSAAEGKCGFGEGGGPTQPQRFLLGYARREDYVDSEGNAWRPSSEVVCVLGRRADTIERTWWTQPQSQNIERTPDPELYRYGMHAPDFIVNFTVGPGTYHVRIKFAETRRDLPAEDRAVTVEINGKEVVGNMDIAASAGGFDRAVDVVLNEIEPQNGTIAIRFRNQGNGEAIVQAVEVGPDE